MNRQSMINKIIPQKNNADSQRTKGFLRDTCNLLEEKFKI